MDALLQVASKRDYTTPDGIVAFVRDVLKANPTPYQVDILSNFATRHRAAIRGPHGLGKTALSSWVILWGISCHGDDVKVVTTASAWRQLVYYTWPEVRKWAVRADWSQADVMIRYGVELLEYRIKLTGREAFPVASNDPALIEGAHANTLIYVFDEAKAIPAGTWDAAEGAFSNAGADTNAKAYALAISTPGEPSGRFYDIHKRRPGFEDWYVRHVTVDEAIDAGRISREWVEQRRRQWGENSPVFQNRVLGEFAESSTDSVIPLAWVEQAVRRGHERRERNEAPRGEVAWGLDVAYTGDDKSVLAQRIGNAVTALHEAAHDDPMQTAGRAIAAVGGDTRVPIAVDVIGIGAGTYARLNEQGYNAIPVNVASRSDMKDRSGELGFINLRAALWWALREALDPDSGEAVELPDDDGLVGDLTTPKWTYTSNGRIKIESKDEIRKRLGRSPDKGDAVVLAWASGRLQLGEPEPEPFVYRQGRVRW